MRFFRLFCIERGARNAINDKVYLQYRAYLVWVMQTLDGSVDLTALMFRMAEEVDYDNPGIIKGFQSPESDGMDTIIRWKDFPWNTAIPSQFLIQIKKGGKGAKRDI